MNRLSEQFLDLKIAYVLISKDLVVNSLSDEAKALFRCDVGGHVFDADIGFVDDEYKRVDLASMVSQSISEQKKCEIEVGISYPDKNIEWIKISVMFHGELCLLHAVEQGELVTTRRLNRQLSMLDPHTGLLYREAFLAKIYSEYTTGLVCCVRICNYQRINEIWGTAVANLVFMEILARVNTEIDDAICSKHSTDSFNIFIPFNTAFDVEGFYRALNAPFHFNGRHFFSNVALGYYLEKEGDSHEQSLNKAEMAILDVLSERVRLAEFQEDLARQIEHQNNLENEFRAAVSQGDLNESFYVVFQPVHDTFTEQVTGAECLIRWTVKGQMVSPVEFIPIAERIGDIGLLTKFNVKKLQELIIKLENKGVDTTTILFALNISVVEILDVDFVSKLSLAIKNAHIEPENIKLELTESALIDNFNYVNQVLKQLQNIGFKVSIDDFGTGFSSLSYLCRLSFDEIKIDRAFVTHVVDDTKLQTVFNSIASLATNLNKPVVAEGVETLEQLDYAREKNIEFIQGYYFSKPLSEHDFIEYVLEKMG
ncbi:bifunctional diguanylate cyclase/phosphodiesterase [Vibrio sp. YMD68]|uniref:bifunctional diguanylate cyclase/phosphodiesterase n=1 Tax=Vibrio sp. YMD68 TaxID=3042300 RepID=UPI00249A6F3B|nr:bifunctional diguanylate cyclase/phosphodiesterase [Vibrio sp. YMD68]WGW01585.1 bifunctional diguanylate cyclase/phosphodiesterase [Vibrio sp. YMD68]